MGLLYLLKPIQFLLCSGVTLDIKTSESTESLLQARRKEIVAQEKSHRQKRRDSLIKALGSLEEKAALLMRKRTADAEMAREQKLREIEQRKNAIIARRCGLPTQAFRTASHVCKGLQKP